MSFNHLKASLRDYRGVLLLAILAMLLISMFKPTMRLPSPVQRWLIVVDITQSMNVSDYWINQKSVSRLEFSKRAIRQALSHFPCGSEVALGVFTERSIVTVLKPLEVCEHFNALDETVAQLDWRMAWAADSFVAHGLYDAINKVKKINQHLRLAFITDGHQAPPLSEGNTPQFEGKAGQVFGTILGVGGSKPAPIPKLDEKNNVTGYWDKEEVMRFATFGVNRKTQSVLEMEEGYHGRNAPHGNNPAEAEEAHLSALDATHLAALANQTGLAYSTLHQLDTLSAKLNASQFATWQPSTIDLRPWLAIICFIMTLLYLIPQRIFRHVGRLVLLRRKNEVSN
ncbi:MAG: VWA domain-containing protein [Methylophilus sp.]|nr:VWA domain-containing protein [Methylophilus sp.]